MERMCRQLICLFSIIFALVGPAAARAVELTTQTVPESELPSNAAAIIAAVGSNPNTSWFWTGRRGACASEDDGVKTLAATLASSYGGSTLEQRICSQKVSMPPFGSSKVAKACWRFASITYATQASGDAFVVIGSCVRLNNTWKVAELPSLQRGGKVQCVYQFISDDNWKNPTFLWAANGHEANCMALGKKVNAMCVY
ncbi:uncharacterized protein LOC119080789 [Bradysia coprophila]|uniref:uncharacterized protein LOC119080789 n=1 Tax=Bradysia coprophila TaxID=38358 RepID=UPI00187DD9BD|nr:uncharacterized protein LOC119080789 [Bradysia coprophila]